MKLQVPGDIRKICVFHQFFFPCILIFWCLFAFIAAGFEHSVANMTIFAVALMSEHPDAVTFTGAAHNLVWVTVGNAISGAGVMGLGYWIVSGRPRVDKKLG